MLKDVTIKPIQKIEAPLHLGQLIGNQFAITIHEASASTTDVEALLSPLQALDGFPNFFGFQRFGGIRPITHVVGKYLTQGNFEAAVMTYIAHPLPTDPEESYRLRTALAQTRDFSQALREYPRSMNFERLILERLVQNPSDFVDAIQALPKNLLIMFVNAYQSYLFNRMVSARIHQGLPLHEAVEGDVVIPLKDGSLQETIIPVSVTNLEKVNIQIRRQKAVVVGVLFGSESTLSSGAMGEIEERILREEKVEARAFIIPELPMLSSSGSWRRLLAPMSHLTWSAHEDSRYPGTDEVHLSFELAKGCYATSLLREVMKASSATAY